MKYLIIILFALASCKNATDVKMAMNPSDLHQANQMLINVSMEDIFSPPVATRVFAYPNLCAYEVYMHQYGKSMVNQIMPDVVKLEQADTLKIDYTIAALSIYCLAAKKLVFSEYMVDSFLVKLKTDILARGVSKSRYDASVKYAESQFEVLSKWIDADHYASVKGDDQYTVKTTDSTWVLTPPNFEPALEPNWNKMRPLFIKEFKDFEADPRPHFSTDKNSDFYKNAMMVYNQSKKSAKPEHDIALHWDCNPNEYINNGHNTYFKHKMSPPGHWMSITTLLSKLDNADFEKTLLSYAATTSAMYDGIISCWNTKYTNELIRPVTYINRYIDKDWEPFIQTPPFPEYTSGHSVASGSATSVLDILYKDVPFIDSTEFQFNLPPRHFASIHEAGDEASISRFYGGIHYKYGVDNGLKQGRKIGTYVLEQYQKLK